MIKVTAGQLSAKEIDMQIDYLPLMAAQSKHIRHLYESEDVFHWLSTGFGKSLCYEVLPFMLGLIWEAKCVKNVGNGLFYISS